MKFKGKKHLIILASAFLITFLAYLWFSKTPYFQDFSDWSRQNIILFTLILLIIKICGIIWPPIPGGILNLGAIPIIGWQHAYAIDLTGSVIGSTIAYFLGKKYGYKFLHKIFDETAIEKIRNTKIKKGKEIEAIFVLKIVTGATISEAICYGAGLLKVGFKNFIIGSTLAHLTTGIPFYYFAGGLFAGKNLVFNIIIILLAIPLFFKFRTRYLE